MIQVSFGENKMSLCIAVNRFLIPTIIFLKLFLGQLSLTILLFLPGEKKLCMCLLASVYLLYFCSSPMPPYRHLMCPMPHATESCLRKLTVMKFATLTKVWCI